jgi:hypothetical protein
MFMTNNYYKGPFKKVSQGGKTWSADHVLAIPMVLAKLKFLKLGTLTWTEFHQIQL